MLLVCCVRLSFFSAPARRRLTLTLAVCVRGTGFVDEDKDAGTPCVGCTAGKYSHRRAVGGCQVCGLGEEANSVQTNCTACAPGKFRSLTTSCVTCPFGTYSARGSAHCQPCTSGFSDNDADASTACTKCPAGTYSDARSIQCVDCAPGFFDSDSNPSTVCTRCDAGQYTPGKTESCANCTAVRLTLQPVLQRTSLYPRPAHAHSSVHSRVNYVPEHVSV